MSSSLTIGVIFVDRLPYAQGYSGDLNQVYGWHRKNPTDLLALIGSCKFDSDTYTEADIQQYFGATSITRSFAKEHGTWIAVMNLTGRAISLRQSHANAVNIITKLDGQDITIEVIDLYHRNFGGWSIRRSIKRSLRHRHVPKAVIGQLSGRWFDLSTFVLRSKEIKAKTSFKRDRHSAALSSRHPFIATITLRQGRAS